MSRTKGRLDAEMDPGFRYRYRLDFFAGDWTHDYVVEGRDGAVQFHVTDNLYSGRHSCGLESHSTTPIANRPPDHARCPALSDRACWHDGTSLYAEERILPMWLEMHRSPDAFFGMLVTEYRKRFGGGKKEDQ